MYSTPATETTMLATRPCSSLSPTLSSRRRASGMTVTLLMITLSTATPAAEATPCYRLCRRHYGIIFIRDHVDEFE